jgi:hypothetical protein
MRIRRVISGGQTGADQGALFGARGAGVETGGWAPRGWLTEDGPAPWLAGWGLREHEPGWAPRTAANVGASDGTLLVGDRTSAGSALTLDLCRAWGRPHLVIGWRPGRGVDASPTAVDAVRRWLDERQIVTLNVAGNRESKAPGIWWATAALVYAVLAPPPDPLRARVEADPFVRRILEILGGRVEHVEPSVHKW